VDFRVITLSEESVIESLDSRVTGLSSDSRVTRVSSALRTQGERLSYVAPREDFGQMIFRK